ncbi:MAG TPA: sugar kinase [Jatrophihabitans sp.]|jgi:sugar/nucleoside kinase (ribokinase family)|nr:sugar kinase [Jatrophihabitans sp.]
MSKVDVVVIGDCNPDIVLSDPDATVEFGQQETLFADGALTVGGSGSITACACARLGLRTAFVGAIGTDAFGDYMTAELRNRGVDIGLCPRLAETPTGFSVIISRGQDRAILTHLGAIERLTSEHLAPDVLAEARHVHLSSYFLLAGLRPGLTDLLDVLRTAGVSTSIDTNWDPAQSWDAGLPAVLGLVDIFLPNAAEACAIAGTSDVEQAALALADTIPMVAVKLGADGALLARNGDLHREPGYAWSTVETTGAGDAFNAGFLSGWLAELPPAQCLQLANAVGALSTQGIGAVAAQPTLAAAQRFLRDGSRP